MFKLIKKIGNIRIGEINCNNKRAKTPCFFATSNFGGGGTNVARLLIYSDLLEKTNIQLLLNYYYINIDSDLKPRFDTKLLKDFKNIENIIDFIDCIKEDYKEDSLKIKSKYKIAKKTWKPLVLLDSGSGNILRNKIQNLELTENNYNNEYIKVVSDFLSFIQKHSFDIGIVMDFAKKNTYKAGELKDKNYLKQAEFFTLKNFDLIDMTLNEWKKEYPDVNLFVPLHGDSVGEYLDYLNRILELEKKENFSFQGFAIGGLGNPNLINKDKWEIPDEVNGKVKGALYLNKICFAIRQRLNELSDFRPIHVLGAASPYNLIPLILSGVDTFDCHSAWRRASDGNNESKLIVLKSINEKIKHVPCDASFSKILIPLINNNRKFISANFSSFLEFKEIHKISQSDLNCNCPICQKFSLNTIKKLYAGGKEENYFAKILIYIHSIYQYQYISEAFSNMKNQTDLDNFISNIPKSKLKNNIILFIELCS